MSIDNQEKIFKQWVEEYKGLMFKVVRSYAVSQEDREDLFQDILLQLWSSVGNFNGEAKETTWIYKVSLNTALVWKRNKKRKRRKSEGLRIDFEQVMDEQRCLDDSTAEQQIFEKLYAAIHELSKVDGSVILMYLDELSYEEMGEVLGISKGNVGVKLNRAKKKLARLLGGLIDDV
jgi:RNA polymerase sigma-70 factor (ECF subfamily)